MVIDFSCRLLAIRILPSTVSGRYNAHFVKYKYLSSVAKCHLKLWALSGFTFLTDYNNIIARFGVLVQDKIFNLELLYAGMYSC